MLIDCFPYFNERELLELRVSLLKDHVDEKYFLFEYLIFKYIYLLINNNLDKYCINIIVAGNDNEINEVKNTFSEFKNLNFILNN